MRELVRLRVVQWRARQKAGPPEPNKTKKVSGEVKKATRIAAVFVRDPLFAQLSAFAAGTKQETAASAIAALRDQYLNGDGFDVSLLDELIRVQTWVDAVSHGIEPFIVTCERAARRATRPPAPCANAAMLTETRMQFVQRLRFSTDLDSDHTRCCKSPLRYRTPSTT